MSAHTQGPWQVIQTLSAKRDLAVVVKDASASTGRLATVPVRDGFERTAKANAALIAAAPAMVELLQRALDEDLIDRREELSFSFTEDVQTLLDQLQGVSS